MTVRTTRTLRLGLAAAGVALLVAAGCGSDDKSDSSSDTTVSPTTTAVSKAEVIKFDKTIQQELSDVGCYTGAIDGILGPQTDAAIVAFQSASGLQVDGELGPETEAALAQAVSKGEKVCTSSGTTVTPTTTTTPATAPCTATALAKALPAGAKIQNYTCSEGYAGVQYGGGSENLDSALLQANGAIWTDLGTTACGGASAGYPPSVLEIACPT
jgi:peptidoglycan hydrolase-like protein with peptidoglycan-binding domain